MCAFKGYITPLTFLYHCEARDMEINSRRTFKLSEIIMEVTGSLSVPKTHRCLIPFNATGRYISHGIQYEPLGKSFTFLPIVTYDNWMITAVYRNIDRKCLVAFNQELCTCATTQSTHLYFVTLQNITLNKNR